MSDDLTHIVPADAWHVPPDENLDAVAAYCREHIHDEVKIEPAEGDLIGFHGSGDVLLLCPACKTVHGNADWFFEAFGVAYDKLGPSNHGAPITAPCCGEVSDATAFGFPSHGISLAPKDTRYELYQSAAFGRASVCIWNAPEPLTAGQRDEISRLMGCPVKLVLFRL